MRLAVSSISEQTVIEIRGDEPWLEPLYRDFPLPGGAGERATLTGRLEFRLEEAGSVMVTGTLTYAPIVTCSRCDKALAWPLRCEVSTRFLPEQVNDMPREKNLSRDDLDAYFLDSHAVDVELLVNDTVQMALPTQFLATDPSGQNCRICAVQLDTEQVYGSAKEPAEKSPFAALKGLKLPH